MGDDTPPAMAKQDDLREDCLSKRSALEFLHYLCFPTGIPISPRQARLIHASFRPRLATTPLRFANPSPYLGARMTGTTRKTTRTSAHSGIGRNPI